MRKNKRLSRKGFSTLIKSEIEQGNISYDEGTDLIGRNEARSRRKGKKFGKNIERWNKRKIPKRVFKKEKPVTIKIGKGESKNIFTK